MSTEADLRREAALVKRFAASEGDLWEWLKFHLEDQQRKLIGIAGKPGLTPEDRSVVCGRLAAITEILNTPARLLTLSDETEKALQEPYRRRAAPVGTPGAL